MKALEIKKASYGDMSEIANFIRSSAGWYEPFLSEKDLSEHYVGKEWIDKNFRRRNFYIGINKDGEKIGTISTQYFREFTYLGYVYLHTDHVGKGHGKELMKFAEKDSLARDQKAMILIAHPQATWATRSYEKFGFKKFLTKKKDILAWENGLLRPYYEEGFHLYRYNLDQ